MGTVGRGLTVFAHTCADPGRATRCAQSVRGGRAAKRPTLVVTYEEAGGTPGDFNGDGNVNGADLGLMLAVWGTCPGCPEDMNGDGVVDGADMGLLLASWT